jgi:DNA-binding MarR family transcriptional regulator
VADRSAARRLDTRGRPAKPRPVESAAKSTVQATSLELDRLIHERVRLAIVSALAVNPSLSFNELKEILGTTDGNLSVHARKLEDAGYVRCSKSFRDRVPLTEFALTDRGRAALERYLTHMEDLIRMTKGEGA